LIAISWHFEWSASCFARESSTSRCETALGKPHMNAMFRMGRKGRNSGSLIPHDVAGPQGIAWQPASEPDHQ
jgi:hypothetical protein